MKKYRIAIEETLRKVVEIEAETPAGLPAVPERCLAQPFFHGAHSPVLLPRKHDGVPAA